MTPQPSRAGHRRYVALALITLVLTISTGNRATLAIAGPSMGRDLGLSAIQLGWLFSAFAWTYAFGQIPAGWICDRIGAKRIMLWGLIVWSLITMAMALVGGLPWPFWTMGLLRLALGLFETPVGPASGRIIAGWFPIAERGVAGSVFNSAQYLALIFFLPLMGWLATSFSWREVFWVPGVLGLITAALWLRYFHAPGRHPHLGKAERDYIQAGGALTGLDAPDARSTKPDYGLADIGALFRSRMLLGVFLGQYCINAITWFFVSWFPAYLVNGLHLSILTAGFMAILPAFLGLMGSLFSGLFSDYLLRVTGSLTMARKIPITIGLLISFTMLACIVLHSNLLIVLAMSVALFGKGISSGMVWTLIADVAPERMTGLTGGVSNAFANFAGVVTPVVIGYILARENSFDEVLVYVCAHSAGALACYWLLVGKLTRVKLA
ncbi:MAG TPA: MFS transporter [Rhizomicrobium sp.]|nr:MFS transporter [Rhizomicrobium sp.]